MIRSQEIEQTLAAGGRFLGLDPHTREAMYSAGLAAPLSALVRQLNACGAGEVADPLREMGRLLDLLPDAVKACTGALKAGSKASDSYTFVAAAAEALALPGWARVEPAAAALVRALAMGPGQHAVHLRALAVKHPRRRHQQEAAWAALEWVDRLAPLVQDLASALGGLGAAHQCLEAYPQAPCQGSRVVWLAASEAVDRCWSPIRMAAL